MVRAAMDNTPEFVGQTFCIKIDGIVAHIWLRLRIMSQIAQIVLEEFNKLPSNGKAKSSEEFTVLAGIVGYNEKTAKHTVISVATGTKCIGSEFSNCNGCIIHDSHAEILARRSFIVYLTTHIQNGICDPKSLESPSCPIEFTSSNQHNQHLFCLKPSWSFHLYVSDSPCGDASIYPSKESSHDLLGGNSSSFTGAKLIQTEPTAHFEAASGSTVREQGSQALGAVRKKSGRSDIAAERRTTSMSCSDKLARWVCLGIQG